MKKIEECPCGSSLPFESCCHSIITGQRKAATAEELMRSRYTAFTLADAEYLMKSWHPQTRDLSEKRELQNWAKSVQWVKLQVIDTEAGLEGNTVGSVEFVAYYREKGKLRTIKEKSSFTIVDGHWVYVTGIHK